MEEGKKQLITAIYEKFWKELYIVAFRRLRSEEEVEDILQDIFVSLLTGEVRLDNDDSIRAFLHQRLKSRIINFYRKKLIHMSYEEREVTKPELADTDSETRLMSRELEDIVKEEINRMPEKMKEIFLLSRNDLLTNEQIASHLNLSNQTVRNQISSAIKRIREAVRLYGEDNYSPTVLNTVITIGALLLSRH